MPCFNCGSESRVHRYRFDPDLPAVDACRHCIYALNVGDTATLTDLKDGASRRATGTIRPWPPNRK